MKLLFPGIVMLFAVGACTPSSIKHDFSQQYGCPENKVEVDITGATPSGSDTYDVSGCGRGVAFYCRSAGCASPQITIARRQAREFDCPSHLVQVEYLDGGAWKASGCGHDTTYHCIDSDQFILRCFAETTDRDRKAISSDESQ